MSLFFSSDGRSFHHLDWLGGVVVRSWTSDSEVAGLSPTTTSFE